MIHRSFASKHGFQLFVLWQKLLLFQRIRRVQGIEKLALG